MTDRGKSGRLDFPDVLMLVAAVVLLVTCAFGGCGCETLEKAAGHGDREVRDGILSDKGKQAVAEVLPETEVKESLFKLLDEWADCRADDRDAQRWRQLWMWAGGGGASSLALAGVGKFLLKRIRGLGQ